MLRQVGVFTPGETTPRVILPVGNSEVGSKFFVKEITGLGPGKATISTASYAFIDGAAKITDKSEMRNIIIKIKYRDEAYMDQSLQELRRELYAIFRVKQTVNLVFTNDNPVPDMQIEAIVESHEPVMFAAEPEVQISLLAMDPHFKSLAPAVSTIPATGGGNSSNINHYSGWAKHWNLADIPAGVEFEWTIGPSFPAATVSGAGFTWGIYMQYLNNGDSVRTVYLWNDEYKRATGADISPGNIITYRSVPGIKGAIGQRGSNRYNVVGALTNSPARNTGADFPHWVLMPAEPTRTQWFRMGVYGATNAVDLIENMTAKVTFTPLYEGM